MLVDAQPPWIQLPRGWQGCVKSAVLYTIALAFSPPQLPIRPELPIQALDNNPVNLRVETESNMAAPDLDMFDVKVDLVNTGLPGYHAVAATENGGNRHAKRLARSLPYMQVPLDFIQVNPLGSQLVCKCGVLWSSGDG